MIMKTVIMVSLSSDFISIATLWARYSYLSLTDKKMDAQRKNKNCLRSFVQVVKLEVILVVSGSETLHSMFWLLTSQPDS